MKYIKVFYTGLIGLLLAACTNDTFYSEKEEGTGYLRLALGSIDVELSSTSRAETVSLPDDLIPQTADFMIDIRQGNSSVEGFPKKYSELPEEGIELMAGGYTVTAYCGENNPVQNTPYFSGSATVQIRPNEPVTASINAALANAMLTPAVSESLQNHYSAWTLTVKSGESSMKLADNENADSYLFAQAGQPVNAAFEGTNILGNKSSHEWTVIFSAAAQTKYVIQCDPDLSVFSNIQLTATAAHTYAENVLTGTNVTLNIEDNGAPLELVDGWNIQLLYNNTAIRSYTDKPENGTLMEVTNGWPYVPQGSTLMASIHLQTGETINLTSVAMEEIPAPEFTATVSGNTSYSVYKSSGVDAANTKDGSSIFDINATATIASEISGNPNYSDILKVTYTTDSGQSSEELPFGTATQFNSLAWQKHALTATVSFDGVEKTSLPVECDVTGLPYVPSAMVEADWDLASWNCKYENGIIQLGDVSGSRECTATSTLAFYIPDNIGVKLNTNVTVRASKILWWQNTTFTVNVNGTTVISQYSDNQDNNNTGKNYSLSGTGTFSPSACEVKLNSSYKAAGPWSKVYTLHILYN
ncbi:DUF4493 domain-containing protein [Phocaeicola barnesiae]|uniref:DUF4493 domain-containing protein n=1 Tax=Phocaeicola barnesiae TaxID=376804 RepID=UPI0025A33233|nr:DUF4493 domain-containing protein [Phocaeicola barnesiae]MDM8256443.1 DUF4493 domain-containing protein [Phocaeicola barnesiae]